MNKISVLKYNDYNEQLCTGCGACINVCPVNAISMQNDREGFFYPIVSEEKCIHCSKCKDNCPAIIYNYDTDRKPDAYMASATKEIKKNSTSGGVFRVLADWIIESNGVIYGSAFDKENILKFCSARNEKELFPILGTKYLQSKTENCYNDVLNDLKQGKRVLFCGTPCQVAACKKIVGDNCNLYTVDLFCHGVPSPQLFYDYIKEKGNGESVESISFRDKKFGWNLKNLTIDVEYKNGSRYVKGDTLDDFIVASLKAIITRPSCNNCKFCSIPRVGDFSIGDAWGVEKVQNKLNDTGGLSWLLVNSNKGRQVIAEIKHRFEVFENRKLSELKKLNPCAYKPKEADTRRERMFDLYERHGAVKALEYTVYNKYDIGLVGVFSGPNYGNAISYYSLYSILKSMGYEVLMIERVGRDYKKVCKQVVEFIDKNYKSYDIQDKIQSWYELRKLNEKCNRFMVGSDQIWKNSLYIPHFYLLDFVNDNRPKLAYGTSFGHDHFIDSNVSIEEMRFYMKRLDFIAVRESTAVDICKEIFGVEACWVLDPVLLAGNSTIDRLINTRKSEKGNYILSYMLEPNRNKDNVINHIDSLYGLPSVNLTGMIVSDERVNGTNLKLEKDIYVSDWLNLIKNSNFVVTDSFHGMCVSILFEKQFLVVEHEDRGNDRFHSLLGLLGLSSRVVKAPTEKNEIASIINEKIDYTSVNALLNKNRNISNNVLSRMASLEVSKELSQFDIIRREVEQRESETVEKTEPEYKRKILASANYIHKNGVPSFIKLVFKKIGRN